MWWNINQSGDVAMKSTFLYKNVIRKQWVNAERFNTQLKSSSYIAGKIVAAFGFAFGCI